MPAPFEAQQQLLGRNVRLVCGQDRSFARSFIGTPTVGLQGSGVKCYVLASHENDRSQVTVRPHTCHLSGNGSGWGVT